MTAWDRPTSARLSRFAAPAFSPLDFIAPLQKGLNHIAAHFTHTCDTVGNIDGQRCFVLFNELVSAFH